MIEYNNGIHIDGTNLWLDARDPQELCFISHAHIDHLGRHAHIIVSQPTARFYEHRMRETTTTILEFNKPTTIDGIQVELFPAGHILGSSQILIHKDNTRIVYSGDFKIKKNETAEHIQIQPADILIMEATYGDPKFLFPDRAIIINQLCSEIDHTLNKGMVPVCVAYSLGKGQEVAKILGDRGYKLVLHNTIYDLLKVYEDFGITFQNYEKSYVHTDLAGKILIMPPYVISSHMIRKLKIKKLILLSGWALDTTKINYRIDTVLPLSDHADFNELLEYVRQVNPQEIYVTHGNPQFVDYLSQIGYKASFLGSSFKVDA